jgi:hypothetical protein
LLFKKVKQLAADPTSQLRQDARDKGLRARQRKALLESGVKSGERGSDVGIASPWNQPHLGIVGNDESTNLASHSFHRLGQLGSENMSGEEPR